MRQRTSRIPLYRWPLHLVASDMGMSCLPETVSHSPTRRPLRRPTLQTTSQTWFSTLRTSSLPWMGQAHTPQRLVYRVDLHARHPRPDSTILDTIFVPCAVLMPPALPYRGQTHTQHDWRDRIPAPLTYLYDHDSAVQPLEPNYYEPHRMERRRRERHDRSTTPRPTWPDPATPRTPTNPPTAYSPQPFLLPTTSNQPQPGPNANRPGTPPRSQRFTPSNFPTANLWTPQGPTRQPPAAPTPIQNSLQQPVPPPTPSYVNTIPDVWNQSSDDDPPFPPHDLPISARPNLEPANLPSREITNSSSDFYTRPLPRQSFRDFTAYITNSDRFAPFADWQIPTRLLEETYNRSIMNNSDPGSTCQMTWWGLLHRQSSLYSDQQTYTEQTLTIPLPTNTADPETSILTTFFYMFMNQERTRAFQSTETPIATTRQLLNEWIGLAGDLYRLSTRQFRSAQRITNTMATVILDIINANVPVEQRQFVPTDCNVTLDALTHRLRFYDPWRPRTESIQHIGALKTDIAQSWRHYDIHVP